MRYMHLSPSATTDEGIAMLTKSRVEGGKAVSLRTGSQSG
jgi:hypothetical protein